jgi:RNA polymerase sigma-70 factor (ECF subfamily)
MIQMQKDAVLLKQLKAGNQTAFAALYERHRDSVYLMAAYTLNDRIHADDIVQDVFSALWKGRSSIDISTSLRNYLITAAKNKSLDVLKTKSHYNQYVRVISQHDTGMEPNHKLESEDIMKSINAALCNVNSPVMRDAFKLVHIQGLNYEETSKELGISVETSRNYVWKTLKILRIFLQNPHNY